jgi:hypothetical protein
MDCESILRGAAAQLTFETLPKTSILFGSEIELSRLKSVT